VERPDSGVDGSSMEHYNRFGSHFSQNEIQNGLCSTGRIQKTSPLASFGSSLTAEILDLFAFPF
jgi:hypothetical protein